ALADQPFMRGCFNQPRLPPVGFTAAGKMRMPARAKARATLRLCLGSLVSVCVCKAVAPTLRGWRPHTLAVYAVRCYTGRAIGSKALVSVRGDSTKARLRHAITIG